MNIKKYEGHVPVKSKLLSLVEVVEVTGVQETRLAELIELSWIAPQRTSGDEYLFRSSDVYRIQKLIRICEDFSISNMAGTIIVDLLDRVEDLQRRVAELERLGRP